MGKPTGFMDYERQDKPAESPLERIKHFNEFLESRLQEWPVDVHCTTLCQSGMT